jgi:hypothetical protein
LTIALIERTLTDKNGEDLSTKSIALGQALMRRPLRGCCIDRLRSPTNELQSNQYNPGVIARGQDN